MHWRQAHPRDDSTLLQLCAQLYQEDPSPYPDAPANMAATLAALRTTPCRGQALVLADGPRVVGYSLLIAFYSNELGGLLCWVDELYVAPAGRGQGRATALLQQLSVRPCPLLSFAHVAVQLEVTPDNARARHLYTRAGFRPLKNDVLRMAASTGEPASGPTPQVGKPPG